MCTQLFKTTSRTCLTEQVLLFVGWDCGDGSECLLLIASCVFGTAQSDILAIAYKNIVRSMELITSSRFLNFCVFWYGCCKIDASRSNGCMFSVF